MVSNVNVVVVRELALLRQLATLLKAASFLRHHASTLAFSEGAAVPNAAEKLPAAN